MGRGLGTGMVESYLADRGGHEGIKAARSQYEAWLDIVGRAQWRNPEEPAMGFGR